LPLLLWNPQGGPRRKLAVGRPDVNRAGNIC
jgi:hypothetical protein